MKNVVCVIISVAIFGIILYGEYEKTVMRNRGLVMMAEYTWKHGKW